MCTRIRQRLLFTSTNLAAAAALFLHPLSALFIPGALCNIPLRPFTAVKKLRKGVWNKNTKYKYISNPHINTQKNQISPSFAPSCWLLYVVRGEPLFGVVGGTCAAAETTGL